MNMTSFLQDKRLTIALKGEIDHHSAKDTMRIIGNKIDIYLPMVCVLDFRDVTFMDSSGVPTTIKRYLLVAINLFRFKEMSPIIAFSGMQMLSFLCMLRNLS